MDPSVPAVSLQHLVGSAEVPKDQRVDQDPQRAGEDGITAILGLSTMGHERDHRVDLGVDDETAQDRDPAA
jgi:hypothetical protein